MRRNNEMKKRYNRLPDFWKQEAIRKIFGEIGEDQKRIIEEEDPWIDVDSLTVKIEVREKMRKRLKNVNMKDDDTRY